MLSNNIENGFVFKTKTNLTNAMHSATLAVMYCSLRMLAIQSEPKEAAWNSGYTF